MKLFRCQSCGQVLYFENTVCERCSHRLGYLPDLATLSALQPHDALWQTLAQPRRTVRFCENATHEACNWLVGDDIDSAFCLACRHNRTIPDLSIEDNAFRWRKLELAKHWLFYTLLRLGLKPKSRFEDPDGGLAFDFLADSPSPTGPKVLTGHDNGLITIAIEEADDAERERRRTLMHEPYRSLLGHFRHEVGHYFWDVLIRDGGKLVPFREVFGDDTQDYGAALATHYDNGPPRTGRRRSSAPMRARTHGRTGRKPGRTICTLSTRWRWQPRLGSGCSLGWRARRRCRRRSILIRTRPAACRRSSTPGCRSLSR